MKLSSNLATISAFIDRFSSLADSAILESMLHDNMFYMTSAIKDLCKKHDLKLPDYDYEHMFELNMLPH